MPGYDQRPENASGSALLGAIADLRQTLHELIAAQRTLLYASESEAIAGAVAPLVSVAPTAPAPAALKPVPPPAEVASPARKPVPQARIAPAAPNAVETSQAQPVAAEVRPDDPRQRLDALAKLLSARLKPTAGPAVEVGEP